MASRVAHRPEPLVAESGVRPQLAPPVATSGRRRMDSAMPALRGHMPVLDGLRGIAVLAVMAYHFFLFGGRVPSNAADDTLYSIAMIGWSGVDLFFVLSGFLITGILYDTKNRADFFRTFYVRRFLRIFPLYYGVLALVFLILPRIFPSSETLQADAATQFWAWSYLINAQIVLQGWESVPSHLQHFWSLAIEEQFYIVWPVVVFLLSRRAMLWVCAGVVVGSLLLRVGAHALGLPEAAYVLSPMRLDGLAIGAALALAARDARDLRAVLRWARPVLVGAAGLLLTLIAARGTVSHYDAAIGTIGHTLLAAVFGAALILSVQSAARPTVRGRFLAWGPLRFFGKYSYALYVFHQPIAMVLSLVGFVVGSQPLLGSVLLTRFAYLAVATGLAVISALLSWHLCEKHFLNLKTRFSYAPERDVRTLAVAAAP